MPIIEEPKKIYINSWDRKIGNGAFGEVYVVTTEGKRMALKVVSKDDPEIKILPKLNKAIKNKGLDTIENNNLVIGERVRFDNADPNKEYILIELQEYQERYPGSDKSTPKSGDAFKLLHTQPFEPNSLLNTFLNNEPALAAMFIANSIYNAMLNIHGLNRVHLDIALRNLLVTEITYSNNSVTNIELGLSDWGFAAMGREQEAPSRPPFKWYNKKALIPDGGSPPTSSIETDLFSIRATIISSIGLLIAPELAESQTLTINIDPRTQKEDIQQYFISRHELTDQEVLKEYTNTVYTMLGNDTNLLNEFSRQVHSLKGIESTGLNATQREVDNKKFSELNNKRPEDVLDFLVQAPSKDFSSIINALTPENLNQLQKILDANKNRVLIEALSPENLSALLELHTPIEFKRLLAKVGTGTLIGAINKLEAQELNTLRSKLEEKITQEQSRLEQIHLFADSYRPYLTSVPTSTDYEQIRYDDLRNYISANNNLIQKLQNKDPVAINNIKAKNEELITNYIKLEIQELDKVSNDFDKNQRITRLYAISKDFKDGNETIEEQFKTIKDTIHKLYNLDLNQDIDINKLDKNPLHIVYQLFSTDLNDKKTEIESKLILLATKELKNQDNDHTNSLSNFKLLNHIATQIIGGSTDIVEKIKLLNNLDNVITDVFTREENHLDVESQTDNELLQSIISLKTLIITTISSVEKDTSILKNPNRENILIELADLINERSLSTELIEPVKNIITNTQKNSPIDDAIKEEVISKLSSNQFDELQQNRPDVDVRNSKEATQNIFYQLVKDISTFNASGFFMHFIDYFDQLLTKHLDNILNRKDAAMATQDSTQEESKKPAESELNSLYEEVKSLNSSIPGNSNPIGANDLPKTGDSSEASITQINPQNPATNDHYKPLKTRDKSHSASEHYKPIQSREQSELLDTTQNPTKSAPSKIIEDYKNLIDLLKNTKEKLDKKNNIKEEKNSVNSNPHNKS